MAIEKHGNGATVKHERVLRPQPDSNTDILSELQRISKNSVLVFDNRDFEHESSIGQEVLRHIAPDYCAQVDYVPEALKWPELVDLCRQRAAENSRLSFKICHTSASMDEEGYATVFKDLDVTGLSSVPLKAVTETKWRRETTGEWMMYHFRSMRGMRGNDGIP